MMLSLVAASSALMVAPMRLHVQSLRSSPIAMMCDWEAMLFNECMPSTCELGALSARYSPAIEEQGQRRESVSVLGVTSYSLTLEVLGIGRWCMAWLAVQSLGKCV